MLSWWLSCEIYAELHQTQSNSLSLLLIPCERMKGHICLFLSSTCLFEFWSFCKQLFEGINTQLRKNENNVPLYSRQIPIETFLPPPPNRGHRDVAVGGSGHNQMSSSACLSKLGVFNSCFSLGCSCFTFAYLKGSLIWFSQQQQPSPKGRISLSQNRDQISVRFLTWHIQSPPLMIPP